MGVVTLPGLALAVGEPAINPAPRAMIRAALRCAAAAAHGDPGALEVEVGIENGAALAEKTMNARLGIVGGLSVLGTTGVVTPYSCAAWIAAIHRGVDVGARRRPPAYRRRHWADQRDGGAGALRAGGERAHRHGAISPAGC